MDQKATQITLNKLTLRCTFFITFTTQIHGPAEHHARWSGGSSGFFLFPLLEAMGGTECSQSNVIPNRERLTQQKCKLLLLLLLLLFDGLKMP